MVQGPVPTLPEYEPSEHWVQDVLPVAASVTEPLGQCKQKPALGAAM
jgi:hypothetical protein